MRLKQMFYCFLVLFILFINKVHTRRACIELTFWNASCKCTLDFHSWRSSLKSLPFGILFNFLYFIERIILLILFVATGFCLEFFVFFFFSNAINGFLAFFTFKNQNNELFSLIHFTAAGWKFRTKFALERQ